MPINTDFLRQLEKFDIIIKKRVASSFIGERKSERVGSGLIFSDYANYSFGDDFKNIDWRAYGRTDRLFVKRFEEDRNLTVHLVVDFSGSMNFGSSIKKFEYASMVALGFSYIALRNNEKFVLSTFDDKLDFFKPMKGGQQLASILHYLNSKKASGVSSFENSLFQYKSLIGSKALVIIISDFFYDIEQIRNVLYRYKHNKVKLIQVLDSMERKLNIDGDYTLVDLERNASIKTFLDPYLKKKYFDKLEAHNAQINGICGEIGADFYSVSNGEDIFDAFYRILN